MLCAVRCGSASNHSPHHQLHRSRKKCRGLVSNVFSSFVLAVSSFLFREADAKAGLIQHPYTSVRGGKDKARLRLNLQE